MNKPWLPDPLVVGQRIRLFRRHKHLSQIELARRIGIKAGPMNNLEQGRNLPSTPVAIALAGELDVPLDLLLAPGPAESNRVCEQSTPYGSGALSLPDGMSLFRPRELPDAERTRLGILANAYLALEDLCHAPKQAAIPLDLPVEGSDAGLEELVRRVRAVLDIGQSVVFDYLELLENAGLRIIFCPLPEAIHSAGAFDRVNRNVIFFINAAISPERQLFRLAYELGWIYLRDATPTEALPLDRATRRFAAYFLMPAAAVRQTVAQLGIAPHEWSFELILRIKHRFGVSAESFIIRLEELRLIDPAIASQLKTRIRNEYPKTGFAEPDASRRRLSPNGRLGDLLLRAGQIDRNGEAEAIACLLDDYQIDCTATPQGPPYELRATPSNA